MSCEYCKHETYAYNHWVDENNCDHWDRVAEPLLYDECLYDAEPIISWSERNAKAIDYADHAPRLCVTAYTPDGCESSVCIPINFCPICGRRLPKTTEVYK